MRSMLLATRAQHSQTVTDNTLHSEAPGDHAGAEIPTVPAHASSLGGHQGDRSWLAQMNGTAGASNQFAHGITEPVIFTISDRRVSTRADYTRR
eukprot:1191288-Prorocentrum_minimum.AAC.3